MLGPAADAQGGIAAVIATYVRAGLPGRCGVQVVATHTDGGGLRKLVVLLGALLRVGALLIAGKVCALHIHTASRRSFWRKRLFMNLARRFDVPYLLHVHGGGFPDFFDAASVAERERIQTAFATAAGVFVLSDAMSEALRSRLTLPALEVLRNPVELPAAHVPVAEPKLLFLGELSVAKGVFDLLEAAAQLAADFPELSLDLCGKGERAPVAARMEMLGLEQQVALPGFVSGADKAARLRGAAIFALTSHLEALPVALLEAMANGLAVVATRVGAMPEVITDGVDGLLVPPGDVDALAMALRRLLEDPALRARLGAAAREKMIAHYSVEQIMAQLERRYAAFAETAAGQADA